jgi:hypothetical protein
MDSSPPAKSKGPTQLERLLAEARPHIGNAATTARYRKPTVGNFYSNSPSSVSNTSFADRRRGCKSGSATLRARVSEDSLGSDADETLPSCIADVKKAYGDNWVSGHVINADFGGDGQKASNQTCLTTTTNRDHMFDDTVKRAWARLSNVFREIYTYVTTQEAGDYLSDLAQNWALQVEATVRDASWGARYPDSCITTGVDFTVTVVGSPTLTDLTTHFGASRAERLLARADAVGTEIAAVAAHPVNQPIGVL